MEVRRAAAAAVGGLVGALAATAVGKPIGNGIAELIVGGHRVHGHGLRGFGEVVLALTLVVALIAVVVLPIMLAVTLAAMAGALRLVGATRIRETVVAAAIGIPLVGIAVWLLLQLARTDTPTWLWLLVVVGVAFTSRIVVERRAVGTPA